MPRSHQTLLVAAGLLVAACATKSDDRTTTLKDSIAHDTALANDLAKAADTAAVREAADIAVAPDSGERRAPAPSRKPAASPRPAPSAPTPTKTPTAPKTPGPRTDRTPSIPLDPGVVPPDQPATGPASGPPSGAAGLAARDANYPIAACENPSQETQRRCLMAYLARSDVLLDRNYQALIAELSREAKVAPGQPEPESVRELRAAQRAWLVYRDTECRQRNRGQEGAIWAPVRAACLGEFSGRRAEELAGLLAKRRGGV